MTKVKQKDYAVSVLQLLSQQTAQHDLRSVSAVLDIYPDLVAKVNIDLNDRNPAPWTFTPIFIAVAGTENYVIEIDHAIATTSLPDSRPLVSLLQQAFEKLTKTMPTDPFRRIWVGPPATPPAIYFQLGTVSGSYDSKFTNLNAVRVIKALKAFVGSVVPRNIKFRVFKVMHGRVIPLGQGFLEVKDGIGEISGVNSTNPESEAVQIA